MKMDLHKITSRRLQPFRAERNRRVESYLPNKVRLDVRGNWGLKEMCIVDVSRPVRAGYGSC